MRKKKSDLWDKKLQLPFVYWKSRRVTGRCFNLFTSNAKHFCMVVFHAFSAAYKWWQFACAAVAFYSLFLDEGKEPRLVAVSCAFPRIVMLSFPPSFLIIILISLYYFRCLSHHSCMSQAHTHFGQSGNTSIKMFTCMYISIKIGIRLLY